MLIALLPRTIHTVMIRLIIIVTNQSGINRGFFTDEEFNVFHNELLKKLEEGALLLIRHTIVHTGLMKTANAGSQNWA